LAGRTPGLAMVMSAILPDSGPSLGKGGPARQLMDAAQTVKKIVGKRHLVSTK
jgi:hypothetical protein